MLFLFNTSSFYIEFCLQLNFRELNFFNKGNQTLLLFFLFKKAEEITNVIEGNVIHTGVIV